MAIPTVTVDTAKVTPIPNKEAKSNWEYLTLVNCTAELVIALYSDDEILHYLDREGFIKPNIYKDVSNPKSLLSKDEKAGLLVTGIKNKVKLNPKNYHKLMRYFHQDRRMYGDIGQGISQTRRCV